MVKAIKSRPNKNEKEAFKLCKQSFELTLNNFRGNESEALLILKFKEGITDVKECLRLWKNFFGRFKRKIKKDIKWIRVLNYKEKDKPSYDFWIGTKDNSKLEIQQEELEADWEDNGEIIVVRLTPSIVEDKARYFLSSKNKMECYPPYAQICKCITDGSIKPVPQDIMPRGEAEKETAGYTRIHASTKPITVKVGGDEWKVQQISFEDFRKEVKTIKGVMNTKNKYKRIKGGNL